MIVVVELGMHENMPLEPVIKQHPTIHFYCFEPRPEVKARFENVVFDNFTYIPKAVWISNEFRTMQTGGQGSSLVDHRSNYSPLTVECIDFDEWIRANLDPSNYNVVRSDIELSEFVVFPHLIAKGSMIYFKEVHIEWHNRRHRRTYKNPQHTRQIYLDVVKYCGDHGIRYMKLNKELNQFSPEDLAYQQSGGT